MTCTHHLRLPHTTYDLYTPPTTFTHHLRLPNTTYDFHTPPTTSKHHLRLPNTNYDLYTPHTTSRHHLQLPHTTYDFYTLCTTSTRHLGREMTIKCLEIDRECHRTSRCYARRFLSDDSFAAILTILFSYTCTTVLVGAQL